jgi:hypothetical protein
MPGLMKWPGRGGPVVLDLTKCDPALLQLADAVVTELSAKSTRLRAFRT